MQIGVISGPSIQEAKAQISYAAKKADALEIRADLLIDFDPYALLTNIDIPIILTKGDKTHLTFPYAFIDIGLDLDYLLEVKKILPQAKTIASFHDFTKTPDVLDPIFDELLSFGPDYIKIACYANDEKDADRMIEFSLRKRDEGHLVIGICMGSKGVKTRLHSLFDYRAIPFAKKVAEGQFIL